MDKSRNYILDRITSKKTSIEEFNFDQLQAPPLSWFFSPFDIQELNSIARSIKYSAKPQARYEAINRVCNRCGLVKFAAGTNRVVYRHPEFPDILFKIAADDVGLGDNPAEYRNQFLLKPFVTKTFEISPCGTVAIVERVNPITSREEYISVADDVFTLITEWLVGRYVLADIGARYFMNIGIRRNFGVVLLDYPYCYELDGNKLYCNKSDPTSPSGKCDGEIDYDDGFNFLHCTKCGAIYKAKELEKKIKDNEIIIEKQGEIDMKIKVSGGSKNVNGVVNTGMNNDNFLSVKSTIPTPDEMGMEEKIIGDVSAKDRPRVVFNTNEESGRTVAPVVKPRKIADIVDNVEVPVKEELAEDVDPVINVNKTVNGVPNKLDIATSPISFSEDVKNKALEDKEEETISPVEEIDESVNRIIEMLNLIKIDTVKNDTIVRVFDALAGMLPITAHSFDIIIRLASDMISELEDDEYANAFKCESIISLGKHLFSAIPVFKDYNQDGTDLIVDFDTAIVPSYDYDNADAEVLFMGVENQSVKFANVYPEPEDETEDNVSEDINEDLGETDLAIVTTGNYIGMKFYDAQIVDIKDIFPSEQRQNVVVLTNTEGEYLAINGEIVAADVINDQSVQNIAIASKDFINELDNIASTTEEAIKEDIEEVEAVEATVSTGALPPTTAMSTDEFLAQEAGENTSMEV